MSDTLMPQQLLDLMPYATTLGITLENATPARVTGSLAWSAERCTAQNIMHGGAIMSLADTIGAICAFLNLPEGTFTATTDSATRLFRPVTDGTLHATAEPVQVGRTLIVVQTDLRNDAGKLVARTSQAQAVITPA